MRYVLHTAIIALCFWAVVGGADASSRGSRGMGYDEALQAKREARAAARAAARRTEAQERKARNEARWIRRWTRAYGPSVGRWADESLQVGWPRGQMWTLGRIIKAESGGRAKARNPYSDCRGLLQLAPCHWRGKYDPFDPRKNLAGGLKLWRGSYWYPWVTW